MKKLCTKYNRVLQNMNTKDSLGKIGDSYERAIDIDFFERIKQILVKPGSERYDDDSRRIFKILLAIQT